MRRRCTARLADYGPTEIAHGVTLDVDAAEIVCLLGRNGVGKSTLVKAVMGLLKQVRGRAGVLGKQVTGWPAHRIPRLGVGYAPQELGLFQDLTVRDNLSVGLKNSGNRAATKTMFDIFPMLEARLGQRAGSLSGGEQKMLILAMACLGSPELVILDEVTEGIQPAVVGRFSQLISDMNQLDGTRVIRAGTRLSIRSHEFWCNRSRRSSDRRHSQFHPAASRSLKTVIYLWRCDHAV